MNLSAWQAAVALKKKPELSQRKEFPARASARPLTTDHQLGEYYYDQILFEVSI
jgi:hypothetical protein